MRVLVTAAGKHDSTHAIARAIGETLRGRGLAATVARPEDVKRLDRYDAVVVGSAVYAGQWLRPARRFVDRSASALVGRAVWVFSTAPDEAFCPDVGGTLRPRGHVVFPRTPSARPWSAAPAAREWPAVTAWANAIADVLTASVAA